MKLEERNMTEDLRLRHDELTENPTPRVPVCLALDTSGSMGAENKIYELNQGVAEFFGAIRKDEVARYAAEIAIVTFGDSVQKVLDFANIDRQRVPLLQPYGNTPMGFAVCQCLDLLEQTKRVYSQMGVDYYQPWLVLMTDGEPTDDIQEAVSRCRDLIFKRKLTLFPIGIGAQANLQILSQFSPNLPPLRVQQTDFGRFFAWLSKSVNAVFNSNPGDAASASLGELCYKNMDWVTVFMNGNR
jgi:uncharacterized protein YegL